MMSDYYQERLRVEVYGRKMYPFLVRTNKGRELGLQLEKCIGIGVLSPVYSAKFLDLPEAPYHEAKSGNLKCAVRYLAFPVDCYQQDRIMKLKHDNIVQLLFYGSGFCYWGDCAAYELCEGGSLNNLVIKEKLPETRIRDYTIQILTGLNYLHENLIIHTDLKGRHIFLSSCGLLKIGGLNTHIALKQSVTRTSDVSSMQGTWKWMSPEMVKLSLRREGKYMVGRKTDIWSLGCVVLEMITQDTFTVQSLDGTNITEFGLVYAARIDGFFPTVPEKLCDGQMKGFFASCFQINPDLRSSALALLESFPRIQQKKRTDQQPEPEIPDPTDDDKLPTPSKHGNTARYDEVQSRNKEISGPILQCGSIRFKEQRLLGEGAQGSVMVVLRVDAALNNPETTHNIVLKKVRLSLDDSKRKEQIDALDTNVRTILKLKNRNIVHHFCGEMAEVKNSFGRPMFFILMEYCSGGTLHDASKAKISPTMLQRWINDILRGLDYLHGQDIVHRDVKPENIFLSTAGRRDAYSLKIGDLGDIKKLRSNVTQKRELTARPTGTAPFMSPEMIEAYSKDVNIGRATDIWSFGCVVIQMITGQVPAFFKNNVKVEGEYPIMFFVGAGGSPEYPQDLSAGLKEFVTGCLDRVPETRPRANILLQHPLLTKNPEQWLYPNRCADSTTSTQEQQSFRGNGAQ